MNFQVRHNWFSPPGIFCQRIYFPNRRAASFFQAGLGFFTTEPKLSVPRFAVLIDKLCRGIDSLNRDEDSRCHSMLDVPLVHG